MTGIRPDYRIINKTAGSDITAALRPYMIALSLTESADNQNDTLSISLNGQGVDKFPASGTKLEVHLGYQETGLVNFGIYQVDTKTLSGMPLVLTVKAGASDFNAAPLKSQKTRHFDNKTLGDILATIAQENTLDLAISNGMSGPIVPYLRQNQESDMALIKRLAKEHGADGTVKAGKLVFKEKAQPAKTIAIKPSDLVDFRITWTDKPKFDSVVAAWRDRDTNTASQAVYDGTAFIASGTGKVAIAKGESNSLVEAQKKAKAHWYKLHQLQIKASMNMAGNPAIGSKLGLQMQGFIPEVENVVLFVSSVRHEISDGYKTAIEAISKA